MRKCQPGFRRQQMDCVPAGNDDISGAPCVGGCIKKAWISLAPNSNGNDNCPLETEPAPGTDKCLPKDADGYCKFKYGSKYKKSENSNDCIRTTPSPTNPPLEIPAGGPTLPNKGYRKVWSFRSNTFQGIFPKSEISLDSDGKFYAENFYKGKNQDDILCFSDDANSRCESGSLYELNPQFLKWDGTTLTYFDYLQDNTRPARYVFNGNVLVDASLIPGSKSSKLPSNPILIQTGTPIVEETICPQGPIIPLSGSKVWIVADRDLTLNMHGVLKFNGEVIPPSQYQNCNLQIGNAVNITFQGDIIASGIDNVGTTNFPVAPRLDTNVY